jgi:hypothetical protein
MMVIDTSLSMASSAPNSPEQVECDGSCDSPGDRIAARVGVGGLDVLPERRRV